jgi:hypothetical protein
MALHATDVTKDHRPLWSRLADRFPNEKECLAAYVALETAEVLAEAKPASLLSIPNRQRSCGKNLYTLWKEHGNDLLSDSSLGAWELVDRGGSLMLLFYHKEHFELHVNRRDIFTLLLRAGYCAPFTASKVLRQLAERSRTKQFPHEIGLLLGYPPKDVAAFMGWIRLPFTCQGPWKIYGNPDDSLRLAARFRHCRSAMAEQLALCASATQFLGELTTNRHRFFASAY